MYKTIGVPVSCALACLASEAHADPLPITADLLDITYSTVDPETDESRSLTGIDRALYLNRARCDCGQPLRAEVRLRPALDRNELDYTKLIQTFLGTHCDTAEVDPLGEFRRCAMLASGTLPWYDARPLDDFHPLFLASGVALSSGEIRGANEETMLEFGCGDRFQGEGGLWLCAQTNASSGCQPDEFIVKPDDPGTPGSPPSLHYDFSAPTLMPTQLTAVIADRGVQLRWDARPGDINGYRVLCERADGTPAGGQAFDPPGAISEADGKHYYNAHNLCGDQPYLTYQTAQPPAGDGTCGDGVRDPGEACDDGDDNDDSGLCRTDCSLAVSAELHALDWAYLCSDHIEYNERSANIYGLENGVDYNFVLVAYDAAGNPRATPIVARAAPDGAFDPLPGAPPASDCDCRSDADPPWSLALLLALGLRRRRR